MPHTAKMLNRNRLGTKGTYKGKSGGTDTSTGPSAACTTTRSNEDCLAGVEGASGGVGFVLSSTQASIIWVAPTMGATAWRAAESAREWTTRSPVDGNEISIVLII